MNGFQHTPKPVSGLDNDIGADGSAGDCDGDTGNSICDETPDLMMNENADGFSKPISMELDVSDGLVVIQERPSRSDAVKNRRLLLDTAARLFAQQGVDEITMSAVAQAAGVGKGTLYRHFASKAELCHALLDQEQRDLQENTLRRLRGSANPPLDDLRWFVEQVIGFVYRNVPLLNTFDNPTVSSLDFPPHRWWWQTIRALLVQVGTLDDLDYAVDALYVMLDAHTIQFQMNSRGYDQARIVGGLHELIERFTR